MLEPIYQAEWAGLVASLTRRFGDLDLAEEAAAEAFAAAVVHWREGVPPNPGGWLMTTANRRAIDRLRRERRRREKYAEVATNEAVAGVIGSGHDDPAAAVLDDGPDLRERLDDRLALIFICCHPALGRDAQVALTLRLVGGLSVAAIARGLLVSEAAVGQRITRAKAKIAAARLPFRLPPEADLPERLDSVLTVLYLIYNEGYLPGDADGDAVASEGALAGEALRLTRLLAQLLPDQGEVIGLLALILLTEARRPARIDGDGALVRLGEQDRSRWDAAMIAEGHTLIRERIATGQPPGRLQLQAAIAAVHTWAPSLEATDWAQLDLLYGALAALDPSPIVALNHAVVLGEMRGPAAALARVDALLPALADYGPLHATRAELLARLDRPGEAAAAYAHAVRLAQNPAERRLLTRLAAAVATGA